VEPKPKVTLVGEDGNAFLILGKCAAAMKKAKCSKEHITKFQHEAMSGDYNNLLQVAMNYCEIS
jgi:hypothetical protein